MYAWGGDDVRSWKGKRSYDYGDARARYDKLALSASGSRAYTGTGIPNMDLVDPKGKTIKSESENPIVVAVDVTGSMSSWPAEIFDRLPLLYQTLSKYRDDAEFAFTAIGDATCDQYPLQVNDFAKGVDLEAKVNALGAEGGGGSHITESYELFGYYVLNHCKTPNAKSPFLLIYGDEAFYDSVDPKQVEHYIGDKMQDTIPVKSIWDGLLQKFDLYLLHKPYSGSSDKEILEIWAKAIGKQRIIELPNAERAVDIGMGLIAKHWGEYGDFKKSLDARHDDTDVKKSVYTSLRHIDTDPSAKSVMPKASRSKLTKNLLDSKK